MSKQRQGFYQFGSFRLIPVERLLLREGQSVPLTPKVFDLLVVLVEHSGHLLAKEELLKAVWGESHVEEGNLTFSISVLRKSLGESKAEPHYIETVPRSGYRFIADVQQVMEHSADAVAESAGRSASDGCGRTDGAKQADQGKSNA
ncbi:MAG: transcriptional regulator [Pyrinomonadaceae bacterium]